MLQKSNLFGEMIMKFKISFFIFLLLIPQITLCSDYYVDVNKGSNDNSGKSKDEAWKTITYALTHVVGIKDDPANIHIAAGIYNNYTGEDTSFPLKSNIKLIGVGPKATILGGHNMVQPSIDCWDLENVEVRNLSLQKGHGLYCRYSTLSLVNCIIEENNGGSRGGGAIECYSSTLNITDCIIRNNKEVGGNWCYGGGIYSENSTLNILNCEIIGNEVDNKYFGYGGGIYALNSNISMNNCLIAQNGGKVGFGGAIYMQNSKMNMNNCTIAYNFEPYYTDNSKAVELIGGSYSINNSIIYQLGKYGRGITDDVNITYSCVRRGYPGEGNIDSDPIFIIRPWGGYYLSQKSAGNKFESPCVNAGNPIPLVGFNYQWLTTRIDGIFDSGRIDMGYHYPPLVQFELGIEPEKESFKDGALLKILLNIDTAPAKTDVDVYFLMLDPQDKIYSFPAWNMELQPAIENITLPENLSLHDYSFLEITLPSEKPPIKEAGTYTFAILAAKAGTMTPISNLSTVSFKVE
jgi:hypothetical protein